MGRNDSVEKIIKRGIVTLDNSLPEDLGLFWLTAQEIHDGLVNAGVDRSLDLSFVQNALKYNNKGELHLKTWPYQGITYYRSKQVHATFATSEQTNKTVPLDQRYKTKGGREQQLCFITDRGYFKKSSARVTVDEVNEALVKFTEMKAEEEDRARQAAKEEEERKMSKHFVCI